MTFVFYNIRHIRHLVATHIIYSSDFCLILNIINSCMNRKPVNFFLNPSNLSLPLQGDLYKKNKRKISFRKIFNFFCLATVSVVIIVSISSFGLTIYSKRSKAGIITQENVISRLKQHIFLPGEEELILIQRVFLAESLRQQDIFFINVKDGDYLIKYNNMSIIYDYNNDYIKNILNKK